MVTNNYFKIYLSSVLNLAETIVIKSVATVESLNKYMILNYGPESLDLDNPKSWKYYLNVSGEYHPIDREMKVVSLDTLEEIVFNKDNLRIHRATAKAYQYGTRHYLELLNRFKEQESLILGILYPVDIEKAIEAKDNTILSYPTNLVENNEYSFIHKLQEWINVYRNQFRNPQYHVSDELFETATLGEFYLHLVPAILNIRLAACKTNEAHSYHVRRYLASHGFLDEYLDHLSKKQALWCYRNINYIERYAAHQDTFHWLIENILTERGIPVGEFTMRHDISNQTKDLYPSLYFRKNDLNDIVPIASSNKSTLEDIFIKEDKLAKDNKRFRTDDYHVATEKMVNSLSNVLQTKVLESSMYDYTDSEDVTLSSTLVNQWVLRAFNGSYKAIITATNPKSGERIPLSSKDALYLLYYVYRKWVNQDALYLPSLTADRVLRDPLPTAKELLKYVPRGRIGEGAANLVLDFIPTINLAHSIEVFYQDCVELTKAANLHAKLISTYEDLDNRAYAENMVMQAYCIREFKPSSNILYEEWLNSKNIHVEELTQEDYGIFFTSLLKEGTGVNLGSTITTRSLQRAMINLMLQLGSYSVHYITDINESSIKQGKGKRIRVGERKGSVEDKIYVTTLTVEVLDTNLEVVQSIDYNASKINNVDGWYATAIGTIDYKLPKLFNKDSELTFNYHYRVPIARLDYRTNEGIYPNKWNIAPMWSTKEILGLSDKDTKGLVDIYQIDYGCTDNIVIKATPINDISVHPLNGFKDLVPELRYLNKDTYLLGFKDLTTPISSISADSQMSGFKDIVKGISFISNSTKLDGFKDGKVDISYLSKDDKLLGFKDLTKGISYISNTNKLEGFKDSSKGISYISDYTKLDGFKDITTKDIKLDSDYSKLDGFKDNLTLLAPLPEEPVEAKPGIWTYFLKDNLVSTQANGPVNIVIPYEGNNVINNNNEVLENKEGVITQIVPVSYHTSGYVFRNKQYTYPNQPNAFGGDTLYDLFTGKYYVGIDGVTESKDVQGDSTRAYGLLYGNNKEDKFRIVNAASLMVLTYNEDSDLRIGYPNLPNYNHHFGIVPTSIDTVFTTDTLD